MEAKLSIINNIRSGWVSEVGNIIINKILMSAERNGDKGEESRDSK